MFQVSALFKTSSLDDALLPIAVKMAITPAAITPAAMAYSTTVKPSSSFQKDFSSDVIAFMIHLIVKHNTRAYAIKTIIINE